MGILKKAVLYQKNQNFILEQNAHEVERSNGKLALALLIMGCLAFVPFLVISFVIGSYKHLAAAYIVMFCVLLLFLLLFQKLRRYFSSASIVYVGYGFLVGYSIYTSALITPGFVSVVILFFLFQIPIVIIDKSWRVNLIVVIYALIYMVVAIPFKNPGLIPDEILNCLLFTVFGIGLGEVLRSTKLENFELKRQALVREKTDDLTGLYNRKSLFEYLSKIDPTAENQLALGLLMIDIDYFKAYNDTYGHQAGDECLKEIADYFQSFGKKFNIKFFRYGGEEFIGTATGLTPAELLRIGEKLNQSVFNLKIPHSATENNFVTISIGVSTSMDITTAGYQKLLISQADIALYTAKANGRNRTVQYTQDMTMENASLTNHVSNG